MQAVAELAFLQIADEAIDPGNRFSRRGRCGEAEIVLDAGRACLVADRGHQPPAARRIETVGGRVFVEQLFQPNKIFRQRAVSERWRQMADCDGADAPLRLRRLAGIIDDEGIDDGQIADQRLRPAVSRQRD